MSTRTSTVRPISSASFLRRLLGAGFVSALVGALVVGALALAPMPAEAGQPHCPALLLGQCPFQGIVHVGPEGCEKRCCLYQCPWGEEMGPCEATMEFP